MKTETGLLLNFLIPLHFKIQHRLCVSKTYLKGVSISNEFSNDSQVSGGSLFAKWSLNFQDYRSVHVKKQTRLKKLNFFSFFILLQIWIFFLRKSYFSVLMFNIVN